jgi:hypothetical protein
MANGNTGLHETALHKAAAHYLTALDKAAKQNSV